MPVYLLHGFRWPRPLIRVHIIMQNIDDAAPEWLIASGSTEAVLDNFHILYPNAMASLPTLRFIEQYDPLDITLKSQPYAYVADIVHEVKLGVDIEEVRSQSIATQQLDALLELRDELCNNQKAPVAWYVVVCGDEERDFPRSSTTSEIAVRDSSTYKSGAAGYEESSQWSKSQHTPTEDNKASFMAQRQRSSSISRGFRKVFGMKGSEKPKSLRDLQISSTVDRDPPPPLPGSAH